MTVYQLAEAGRALQPAIGALSAWGAVHGRPSAEGDVLRPAWLLIRALGRPTTLRENKVCEMDIEGEVVSLTAGPAGLRIETGAVRDADATITLSLDVLAALLSSPAPPPARPASRSAVTTPWPGGRSIPSPGLCERGAQNLPHRAVNSSNVLPRGNASQGG